MASSPQNEADSPLPEPLRAGSGPAPVHDLPLRPGIQPGGKPARIDNSSIPFHRDVPERVRSPKPVDPKQKRNDEYIMDTNNSSIVSKRSVEKLYYGGEAEYFRYFVSKFKRRSPLINRGYWLRMKSIEHAVSRFLAEQTPKRKIVVNLGCG
jgi:hypothetical protein